MPRSPSCVVFDVIGTLFSLDAAAGAFAAHDLPPLALPLWFSHTLRNGFALDAAGAFAPMLDVGRDTLATLAAEHGWPLDHDDFDELVCALTSLEPQPDAAAALRRLTGAGVAVIALSNGARTSTQALLDSAGLVRAVQAVASIDDVRRWKPRREVYAHSIALAGRDADEIGYVAAHHWDIHGAATAGLTTAWVSRLEQRPYATMRPPAIVAATLVEAVDALLALPARLQPTA